VARWLNAIFYNKYLKPSQADEELKSKIKEAGKFLNIKVINQIIITNESYFSFADNGF
jgi:DNA repair protein RadC